MFTSVVSLNCFGRDHDGTEFFLDIGEHAGGVEGLVCGVGFFEAFFGSYIIDETHADIFTKCYTSIGEVFAADISYVILLSFVLT